MTPNPSTDRRGLHHHPHHDGPHYRGLRHDGPHFRELRYDGPHR